MIICGNCGNYVTASSVIVFIGVVDQIVWGFSCVFGFDWFWIFRSVIRPHECRMSHVHIMEVSSIGVLLLLKRGIDLICEIISLVLIWIHPGYNESQVLTAYSTVGSCLLFESNGMHDSRHSSRIFFSCVIRWIHMKGYLDDWDWIDYPDILSVEFKIHNWKLKLVLMMVWIIHPVWSFDQSPILVVSQQIDNYAIQLFLMSSPWGYLFWSNGWS